MRRLIFCWSLLLFIVQLTAAGAVVAFGTRLLVQGTFNFAGTILNAKTQRPIIAQVVIYGAGPEHVGKLQTDRNGTFAMTAQTTDPYRFAVTALGYESQEVTVSAQAGPPTAFSVSLVPLNVGTKVTLKNIQFARGKSALLPESYDELIRLVELLRGNEQMEIQLNGHTDNQGDAAQNLALSEIRVKAVQDYLIKKGVAASRLRGQGFGGSQPIASNQQEPTRKLNRRVEFEILKN